MNERRKTRTVSEETQLRKLLKDLTDHVLELKEDQRKNNLVIKARLDDLDAELRKAGIRDRELEGVIADTSKRVTELHVTLLGESNRLGGRLYELEKERGKTRKGRTSRPPGRG